ncbi:MAG: hypothetical protein JNK78_09870 [Planctomycetes bacterium]|nr:hypothetical protein [Planctomycetota bacterium]
MDIAVFSPSQLHVVLRALRAAAAGAGPVSADALAFLEAFRSITGHPAPADALDAIDPRIVADVVPGAHPRKRLVQLAAVAAMVSRPVRRECADYVRALADVLQVRDPVVGVVDALARGRRLRVRMLTMRRMMRVMMKEAWRSEGLLGPLRVLGATWLRLTVNKDRLWSYKKLGLLPEGTLGREFWAHVTSRGFGFPGELGGIPQVVAYHDVGHVLTGYGTEPEGEIRQGAFQAGNRREDGFVFLQFVLLQFHHGMKLTPIAPAFTGLFDPADVLAAVHRGACCGVDITHQWDYWPLLAKPLAEARVAIGLRPHVRAGAEALAPTG